MAVGAGIFRDLALASDCDMAVVGLMPLGCDPTLDSLAGEVG